MKFDIVIVGGGMVGVALACALSPLSLRIALIDSSMKSAQDDPRLIALNYSSACLLKNLNIFEKLQSDAAAIQEVHVSRAGQFGSVRIRAEELNLPVLGFVIPAKNINLALDKMLQTTTTHVFCPATLVELTEEKESIVLTLETEQGKEIIEGKQVIAADGSYSTVRKLLNVPVEQHDYKQSAIVTITDLGRSHQQVAYERFLDDGAVAMLPLTGNRCATIWTASSEKIADLMQASDAEFLHQLQNEFGFRLGRLQKVNKRFVFPLQSMQIQKRVHRRAVFIGNAAHTVHPLAAQGLNLAFYEIALLTQMLCETPLDALQWHEFAEHTFSQTLNKQLSHYLNSLFTVDSFPINIVRQMGMVSMNILGSLKRQFATYPVGRSGRVPRLLLDRDDDGK